MFVGSKVRCYGEHALTYLATYREGRCAGQQTTTHPGLCFPMRSAFPFFATYIPTMRPSSSTSMLLVIRHFYWSPAGHALLPRQLECGLICDDDVFPGFGALKSIQARVDTARMRGVYGEPFPKIKACASAVCVNSTQSSSTEREVCVLDARRTDSCSAGL